MGEPTPRITLRLLPRPHLSHHSSAAESVGATVAALAHSNPAIQRASDAASGLDLVSGARPAREIHRGVLMALPPTLQALRNAALDEARADESYWKRLLIAARQQRRLERAERKRRKKRARVEGSSSSEQKSNADDAEEVEVPDSEDDNRQCQQPRSSCTTA